MIKAFGVLADDRVFSMQWKDIGEGGWIGNDGSYVLHVRAHTTGDSQLAAYLQRCISAAARLRHASYDYLLANSTALREL